MDGIKDIVNAVMSLDNNDGIILMFIPGHSAQDDENKEKEEQNRDMMYHVLNNNANSVGGGSSGSGGPGESHLFGAADGAAVSF